MSQITHLYIKTHNITGLKYFGKTVKDPFKYNGSGKYWTRHIKIYGNNISTQIVASFEEDQREEMTEFALFFSDFFDIVNSNEWANLKPENGLDGGRLGVDLSGKNNPMYGKNHSEETKAKIKEKRALQIISHSEETKAKMRKPKSNTENYKKPKSKEHKLNLSKSRKEKYKKVEKIYPFRGTSWNKGLAMKNEIKEKISKKLKGRIVSEETKLKISKGKKGLILNKSQCLYCKKLVDGGNMKRWHGDNCKNKV